jgi:hypothetical protein
MKVRQNASLLCVKNTNSTPVGLHMAPSPVMLRSARPARLWATSPSAGLGHQGSRMLLRNRGHLFVAQHSKCKYQRADSISGGN